MLPVIKGKDSVTFPETIGFVISRQKGSSVRMKSDDGRYASVPVHGGEMTLDGYLLSSFSSGDHPVLPVTFFILPSRRLITRSIYGSIKIFLSRSSPASLPAPLVRMTIRVKIFYRFPNQIIF